MGRLRKRLTIGKRLGSANLNKVVWPLPLGRSKRGLNPIGRFLFGSTDDPPSPPMPSLPSLKLTVKLPLALIGVAAATALGVGVVATFIASDALTRESSARLSTAASASAR